jgi:hypothetical protein
MVAQTRAAAATISFSTSTANPKIFRMAMRTAAKTMGKMQYPKTHTHWKKLILPPSNLVLMVTTKLPPHITKNTTPNSLPFDFSVMLRMLHEETSTRTAPDRAATVPRDPLHKTISTVAKFPHALRISLHVELRHHHVSQLDSHVLDIPQLNLPRHTIVSQIDSSRESE